MRHNSTMGRMPPGCLAFLAFLAFPGVVPFAPAVSEGPPGAAIVLDAEDAAGVLERRDLSCAIGDGAAADIVAVVSGRPCWVVPCAGNVRYLYVRVNDPRLQGGRMRVKVALTARDQQGVIECHYDGSLRPWQHASVTLQNTGAWRTFVFDLPDAGFTRRCNGYDFRFVSTHPLPVAAVSVELVERLAPPDDFPRDWDVAVIRTAPDRMGFAQGGLHWGKGGMSIEILDRQLRIMKDLGFGWLRYWPEWEDFEPENDAFDWTRGDQVLAAAKRHGIEVLGMVGYCSTWATSAPDDVAGWARSKYPPRDLADVRDYVYRMVSRYKGGIHHWEGWNEANASAFWKQSPTHPDRFRDYVRWQRAFYEAARRADPDCVVLTGGFADDAHFAGQLMQYYEHGLKGTFDAFNMHIYGADPRERWSTGQLEAVIKVLRHHGDGDKRIWITECGWPLADHPLSRTLEQQAEWAPWVWGAWLRYPQVERVFFFQLRDHVPEVPYGWYDMAFRPRPVVARWRALRPPLNESAAAAAPAPPRPPGPSSCGAPAPGPNR